MQVETRKISELRPYPKNPRSITEEKKAELKRKISRWGQIGALLVDGRDKATILGGNHVYEAMQELGLPEAKVEYRTPKDDAEALELVILHNERFASWVQNDLGALLKQYQGEIDLSEYHIDLGKGTALKAVLARYGATEEDDFDGALPESPQSEKGKVYLLGEHRIMCGDSTDPQDVQKLMGGQSNRFGNRSTIWSELQGESKWPGLRNDSQRRLKRRTTRPVSTGCVYQHNPA